MRRTIAALALTGATVLVPAAMAHAQEGDAQSSTATTIDVGTTQVTRTSQVTKNTRDVSEVDTDTNGDDDSDKTGLWGLLGLLGLAGLAGLKGLKRRDDGYPTGPRVTNPAPKTARGATSSTGTTDVTYDEGGSSSSSR